MKLFIQGFYIPSENGMAAVIDPTSAPTNGDTVSVSLASPTAPYNIVYTDRKIVGTNGNVSLSFPAAVLNQSYYVVVRHRNSIETWSKTPILFNSFTKSFDLSSTP
jgi:hypothetical protein